MAQALTLTEAAKLSENELRAGVIATIVNFDPVLGGFNLGGDEPSGLPFESFNSKTYSYVRESTIGSAVWREPNEVITGETSTFSPVTVTPKYLYRQAEVPLPFQYGYAESNNQEQIQLKAAAKAFVEKFMDTFYYGNTTNSPEEPNGLHASIDSNHVVKENSTTDTSAALQLGSLDTCLTDYMKYGCDAIVMPRSVYRMLWAALRSTSVMGTVNFTPDMAGKSITTYDGVPVAVSDYIAVTEDTSSGVFSAKTGGTGTQTSVFLMKYGIDTLHGAHQTPGIDIHYFPVLESKDNSAYRLKWYVVPVVMKVKYGLSSINNVATATAVTA